jgi:ring-1,2-phenylacetyl-CoA epoxidase subunit PaaD
MRTIQQNVTEESVRAALLEVMDPEIPDLSIVDLGIVHKVSVGDTDIEVELLPTFVGCPALDVMKESVQERLLELAPEHNIHVKVTLEETWTTDRISEHGRSVLKSSGFAPPQRTPQGKLNLMQLMPVAECPYCGSRRTVMENAFGPTLCRAIYYCTSCRQPFEQFKQV